MRQGVRKSELVAVILVIKQTLFPIRYSFRAVSHI